MGDILKDENEIQQTINDVRDGKIRWVVYGYGDDESKISVIKTGDGGVDDFKQHLIPNGVSYILFGYLNSEQDVIQMKKNILITFIGPESKVTSQARTSQHKVILYSFIGKSLQLAGELHTVSLDEISETSIAQKLSGSRHEEHTDSSSQASASLKSNVFAFQNEEESNGVIQTVRNDKSDTNWAIWEYDDAYESLVLTGSGSGGYPEVEPKLQADHVLFALLGLPTTEADDYVTTKYILVSWVGESIKPLIKAKASQDKGQLYNHINKFLQLGGEWQAQSIEEISEAKLVAKLEGSVLQEEKEIQESTFKATKTDGISRAHPDYKPTDTGPVKIDFDNGDESEEALAEMRDGKNNINWVVFGYQGTSKKIALLAKGEGDFDNIESFLDEKAIIYSVVGVPFGTGEYKQIKYCFIAWVGPRAKPLLKARSSQHRVALYNYIQTIFPLAGEIQALSRDEISHEILKKKLVGTTILNEEQEVGYSARSKVTKGSMESFKIEDQDAFEKALTSLTSEENDFVVFEENKDGVSVIANSKGQVDEIKKYFEDDNVRYAILSFKVVEIVDDVDYTRPKNVFISWTGPDVKPLAKARSSQQRVPIYEKALSLIALHGQIHVERTEDLTDDTVVEKVTGSRTQKN